MVITDHPEINTSYQAFTNQSFLLAEVTCVARLLQQGASMPEVRRAVMTENVLQLKTEHSRKTFFGNLRDRLQGVGPSLLALLTAPDYDLRRLTNLYLLLLRHRLLREFIAEVVWRELRRMQSLVEPVEVNAFFAAKQQQSEVIAAWRESTFYKARSNLIRIGLASELLAKAGGEPLAIQPQWVPSALRDELEGANRSGFLKLLLDQWGGL